MINMISVVYRWGVNPLIIENRYDGILSRLLLLSHSAAVAFQFERPQRMTMLMAASYSSCYFIIILGGIAIKNQHYYVFAVSMKFFHLESNFDDLFRWKYANITYLYLTYFQFKSLKGIIQKCFSKGWDQFPLKDSNLQFH